MKEKKANPDQLTLSLFTPSVIIPQGDGSVIVKPGRPIQRLTPQEFAGRVGLDRDSIYRYVGTEALPERFIEYAGVRKITIDAAALEHFLAHWKKRRGAEG